MNTPAAAGVRRGNGSRVDCVSALLGEDTHTYTETSIHTGLLPLEVLHWGTAYQSLVFVRTSERKRDRQKGQNYNLAQKEEEKNF